MSQPESVREPLQDAAGSAAGPEPGGQDVPLAQKIMLVVTDCLGLLKNTLDLAALELLVALKALPKLIALSVGLVFLLSLAWISFSVCMSWVAFHFFNEIGAAVFCFLFIQLAAIGLVLVLMKRCKRALTLPNTRTQAKEIAEVINEAFQAREAQENGRR